MASILEDLFAKHTALIQHLLQLVVGVKLEDLFAKHTALIQRRKRCWSSRRT